MNKERQTQIFQQLARHALAAVYLIGELVTGDKIPHIHKEREPRR